MNTSINWQLFWSFARGPIVCQQTQINDHEFCLLANLQRGKVKRSLSGETIPWSPSHY